VQCHGVDRWVVETWLPGVRRIFAVVGNIHSVVRRLFAAIVRAMRCRGSETLRQLLCDVEAHHSHSVIDTHGRPREVRWLQGASDVRRAARRGRA